VRKEEEFEYFFLSPFTSQCRMQNAIRSNSMSRYVLCYLNVCLLSSVFCLSAGIFSFSFDGLHHSGEYIYTRYGLFSRVTSLV